MRFWTWASWEWWVSWLIWTQRSVSSACKPPAVQWVAPPVRNQPSAVLSTPGGCASANQKVGLGEVCSTWEKTLRIYQILLVSISTVSAGSKTVWEQGEPDYNHPLSYQCFSQRIQTYLQFGAESNKSRFILRVAGSFSPRTVRVAPRGAAWSPEAQNLNLSRSLCRDCPGISDSRGHQTELSATLAVYM